MFIFQLVLLIASYASVSHCLHGDYIDHPPAHLIPYLPPEPSSHDTPNVYTAVLAPAGPSEPRYYDQQHSPPVPVAYLSRAREESIPEYRDKSTEPRRVPHISLDQVSHERQEHPPSVQELYVAAASPYDSHTSQYASEDDERDDNSLDYSPYAPSGHSQAPRAHATADGYHSSPGPVYPVSHNDDEEEEKTGIHHAPYSPGSHHVDRYVGHPVNPHEDDAKSSIYHSQDTYGNYDFGHETHTVKGDGDYRYEKKTGAHTTGGYGYTTNHGNVKAHFHRHAPYLHHHLHPHHSHGYGDSDFARRSLETQEKQPST